MKKFLLTAVCLLALTACSQGQAEKGKTSTTSSQSTSQVKKEKEENVRTKTFSTELNDHHQNKIQIGYKKEEMPEYFSGQIKDISDEEFTRLYGREIPDGSWSGEIRMNDAVCQLYYGKGIFGKLFYGVLRILLKISEWQGKPNLNVLFNYNMPIRGYAKMTGGFVTMEMAEALTEMANGHRIKGTGHLIRAAVKRD